MPANDHEVFAHIVGDAGAYTAIDFLTYASFAFERSQWIQHSKLANDGAFPDQAAINAWIANITPYQFEQMRIRAAATFDVAARDYMADEIEAARQQALQDAVVREVRTATAAQTAGLHATLAEVKSAGSVWRQSFIALGTAILAPIIIGGVLAFALLGERAIPTIAGVRDAVMKDGNRPDARRADEQKADADKPAASQPIPAKPEPPNAGGQR